jgi:flagellar basal body-associated protein FliL
MSDKKALLWVVVYSIIRLVLIVLCILLVVYAHKASDMHGSDLNPIHQVLEWTQQPFVDIRVES